MIHVVLAAVVAGLPVRTDVIETGQLRLEHLDGTVVAVTNKLTGETLAGQPEPLCGLQRKEAANTFRLYAAAPRRDGGALEQSMPEGTVTTTYAVAGEAVKVRQQASAPADLRGVQWGLVLPSDAVVLVPGHSGLRLGPEGPVRQMEFEYPIAWECQFVIVETPRGGLLIQALDDAEQFKALRFNRTAERTTLVFETQATAPWETATAAGPLTWRIEAFEGPWQTAARAYAAEHRARLSAGTPPELAWTRDIRCMVIAMPTDELLAALREKLDPRQTMIYLPSWRVDSYDRNYPDYTPAEGLPERVRAAQAAGFRVMLHVNYFGCTPENPAYPALAPYHVRSPRDGSLQYWDWQRAKPPIKFAYVNPAARAWRELFVAKMQETIARTGADALHLDQTLCIYNDANGRIDGLNMMQGNLALHRELREALPGVALGGEGLNEITCRYEQFAQRHLYGLNHADGTWSPRMIALAHPVSSAVLRPQTTMVGYLGYSNPRQHDLFLAWEAGYEVLGIVPTLAHVGAADLRSEDVGVRFAIERARRAQDQRLEPVFEALDPPAAMAWRDAAGRLWPVRREPTGAAMFSPDGQVVERRVTGVSELRAGGSVPGAVAYDAERIFGLTPSAAYFWRPEPRDPAAFHVASAAPEVPLSGRYDPAGLSILALGDPLGGRSIEELATSARCGVKLADGQVTWHQGSELQDDTGATVRPEATLIFVHPPWRNATAAPPGGPVHGFGHTLLELTLPLPAGATYAFAAEVGLAPSAPPDKTDGITCRVSASAGALTRAAEVHAPAGPKSPLRLNLSEFAGQTVRLTLETTPGPAGAPSFDWGEWSRPRLEPLGDVPVQLELVLPRLPATVVDRRGPVELRPLGGNRYAAEAAAPGRLYLSSSAPLPVAAGQSLLDAAWQAVLVDSHEAVSEPREFMRPSFAPASVGGEARPALHTHPPQQGRIEAHLAVRLPAAPLRLVGAAGLRDGNASEGAGFLVAVNDAEQWRQEVTPPSGPWRPLSVDLSRWAGRVVLLTLVVDSLGPFDYDWAVWSGLRVEPATN